MAAPPGNSKDRVSLNPDGSARLVANPGAVQAGCRPGVTEISWDTGDGSEGCIYVSVDGEPETLFASGARGSKDAAWILAGSSYEFRLHAGSSNGRLLHSVGVIGLDAPVPEGESWRDLREQTVSLGYPICEPTRRLRQMAIQVSTESSHQSRLPEITFQGRQGVALVSVCTKNYLPFARALIASIREHHSPEEIAIFLLIVDWDGQEPPDIPGTTLLHSALLGIDQFGYMALKYSATELCSACKPFLIQYVMATTGYHKLLYLDSDIYVFARLDYLLDCLNEANLVVTPHTLAPTPNRERFHEHPNLGDLILSGTYNAGMFGMTVVPENVQLLTQWAELVTAPGAFLEEFVGQSEQQFFNWLAGLADDVKINKDTAYNVAYWNLHDRSLRYTCWDEPDSEPRWQVDGRPLVAFHFSGFSPFEPGRLSVYDSRYLLSMLPSLTELIAFYVAKLFEHGSSDAQKLEYRYDRFPSGLPIPPEVRRIFKRFETHLWRDLSPWCEAGERLYVQNLFLPIPETGFLIPIALLQTYQDRKDLQKAFPDARFRPGPFLDWFSTDGMTELPLLYEYFNSYRPVIPNIERVQTILDLKQNYPASFAGLQFPMSKDRGELITRLIDRGLEPSDVAACFAKSEYFALSPIHLLWTFVEQHAQLQDDFPDLLFDDAASFGLWLKQHGAERFLEPELADVFMQKADGRSLARIFSFLNRTSSIARQWPLALVGSYKEDLAHFLLSIVHFDVEFDLDDVVMYLWVMSVKPWAGLSLTFELSVNAHHSPLLPEGQDGLLGPLVEEPGFRDALNDYRRQPDTRNRSETYLRRAIQDAAVATSSPHSGLEHRAESGINYFGFFKSPIGLGSLSRGLSLALRSAGVHVQENIVGNLAMELDLRPRDFIGTYDYSLDSNLFLSYPHLQERLLETYPQRMVRGRKNIVYLAWEQRDGYPGWARDYADFDQVWALSDFAAGSFRRYMRRADIVTVPGVIDFSALPAPATKQEVRLNPDRFAFLYIFDANSSIERKNPDAVIAAFAQAFSPNDKVQLLLKVSNAHRLDHQTKLRQLANLAARSGLDIRFLIETLPYQDLLKLLSATDCYVSLHRAEGFGYTCAEAMSYGKPVIATNYSATTEFMDPESAYLVDYRECEVKVADGPFQRGSVWAEPSVEHAAAQMRHVFLNQDEARRVGMAGQGKVRQLLSAERIGPIAAAALAGQN